MKVKFAVSLGCVFSLYLLCAILYTETEMKYRPAIQARYWTLRPGATVPTDLQEKIWNMLLESAIGIISGKCSAHYGHNTITLTIRVKGPKNQTCDYTPLIYPTTSACPGRYLSPVPDYQIPAVVNAVPTRYDMSGTNYVVLLDTVSERSACAMNPLTLTFWLSHEQAARHLCKQRGLQQS